MQFVNTTDGITLDENSRWLIRKQASRASSRKEETPENARARKSQTNPTPGKIHRFRLDSKSLKDTKNKPRQVSEGYTILPADTRGKPIRPNPHDKQIPSRKSLPSHGKLPSSKIGEEKFRNIEMTVISGVQTLNVTNEEDLWDEVSSKLSGGATEQQLTWLQKFFSSQDISFGYTPSSGFWDPFNTMSLHITRREQILLHYYFTERPDITSPLMPYCHVFFQLAIQDEAFFHAVLSHYSATYRVKFQGETKEESISHLMIAIRMITARLENPNERCSDGTIGAVASLIIYESVNGALPSLEYHMNGLEEMIRRRGGFEGGNFPLDLKRLIAWTDLMTSNDLWQPPRFPILSLPEYSPPNNASKEGQSHQHTGSPIDALLPQIKSLAASLFAKPSNFLTRYELVTSDAIYALERQLVALIHGPPTSQSAIDNACSIAALMYVQSCISDTACTFRALEISRLRDALSGIGNDVGTLFGESRGKEKLVWVLGFGAGCADGEEREWFVGALRVLCDALKLRAWTDFRSVLDEVLWRSELDEVGRQVWEEVVKV